ncbi:hypothetical protein C3L33_06825, partial [Rhododendron williamsianum]
MASAIASSLSRLSLLRRLTTITTSPLTPTTFLTIKPKSSNRCRFVSSSMASGSKESPSNNPGLQASPDEATKDYFMQQTMYRIKDPKVSLDFYSRVLGMSLSAMKKEGHIGITVDDTYKACERFERLGVEFVKKPDDGKMKGIAFIKDPDGYWIEIFDLKTIGSTTSAAA